MKMKTIKLLFIMSIALCSYNGSSGTQYIALAQ